MKTLENFAKRQYNQQSFLVEWRAFILITIIVKIATMTFSVFAGYFYFLDLFTSLLNDKALSITFSVVNLMLIEVLTAIALSKFFKFALRGKLRTAIFALFLAVGLFSVSFISSTNGLAMRQSEKVDVRKEIADNYTELSKDLELNFKTDRDYIQGRINTIIINPQAWQGNRRSHLTADQLKTIDDYYADIKSLTDGYKKAKAEIRGDHLAKLKNNNVEVASEADRYYNIVAVVMFVILSVNGLLMYFFSKIYEEKTNQFELLTSEIELKAVTLLDRKFAQVIHNYFNAFEEKKPPLVLKDPQGCKHCGQPFEKRGPHHVFCSDECRESFWKR